MPRRYLRIRPLKRDAEAIAIKRQRGGDVISVDAGWPAVNKGGILTGEQDRAGMSI
jgi:hypothetical protein